VDEQSAKTFFFFFLTVGHEGRGLKPTQTNPPKKRCGSTCFGGGITKKKAVYILPRSGNGPSNAGAQAAPQKGKGRPMVRRSLNVFKKIHQKPKTKPASLALVGGILIGGGGWGAGGRAPNQPNWGPPNKMLGDFFTCCAKEAGRRNSGSGRGGGRGGRKP